MENEHRITKSGHVMDARPITMWCWLRYVDEWIMSSAQLFSFCFQLVYFCYISLSLLHLSLFFSFLLFLWSENKFEHFIMFPKIFISSMGSFSLWLIWFFFVRLKPCIKAIRSTKNQQRSIILILLVELLE